MAGVGGAGDQEDEVEDCDRLPEARQLLHRLFLQHGYTLASRICTGNSHKNPPKKVVRSNLQVLYKDRGQNGVGPGRRDQSLLPLPRGTRVPMEDPLQPSLTDSIPHHIFRNTSWSVTSWSVFSEHILVCFSEHILVCFRNTSWSVNSQKYAKAPIQP